MALIDSIHLTFDVNWLQICNTSPTGRTWEETKSHRRDSPWGCVSLKTGAAPILCLIFGVLPRHRWLIGLIVTLTAQSFSLTLSSGNKKKCFTRNGAEAVQVRDMIFLEINCFEKNSNSNGFRVISFKLFNSFEWILIEWNFIWNFIQTSIGLTRLAITIMSLIMQMNGLKQWRDLEKCQGLGSLGCRSNQQNCDSSNGSELIPLLPVVALWREQFEVKRLLLRNVTGV